MWQALVTWICGECGQIGATDEAGRVYCENKKCDEYGKLVMVKIVTEEVVVSAV